MRSYWFIQAHVWGGATGSHSAPLKDRNGNVHRFSSEQAARQEAGRLTRNMNEPPKIANFHYKAYPWEKLAPSQQLPTRS